MKNPGTKQVANSTYNNYGKFDEYVCAHTHSHILAAAPKKKLKKDRRNRAERAMERTLDTFMQYQKETKESLRNRKKNGGRRR